MRGLVAYDSYFGNAGRVAAAIAEELRAAGHHARVIDLHHERVTGSALATESDFLVLGGPTRMKHMSRRARSFAKKIDAAVWAGRPALVYDTYGPLDSDPAKNEGNKWLYPGGAVELRALLENRGLVVVPGELRCLVATTKGPLVEGALDDARAVARSFVKYVAAAGHSA